MRSIITYIIALSLTAPAFAAIATTQSTTAPTASAGDPELGKLFRSRIAGLEFNPPANGSMIRDLNSGEVVRFVNSDTGVDVRVKSIPLHVPLQLTAPGDGGLLEITATQFAANNPAAQILRREVIPVHGLPVGLIEAKYNVGNDRTFTQQAIFKETEQHYLLVQMASRCTSPTGSASDPAETDARRLFGKVIDTVRILDRSALLAEQKLRVYKTMGLWVLFDKNKLLSTIQPLRLMRVIRDQKDIGFIQVDERLATHNHNDGIEVIVRSRVRTEAAPAVQATDIPADTSEGSPATPNAGVDLPGTGAKATLAERASGPMNLFTSATYFVTFDRDHEDWTNTSQIDDQVATQTVESANTDRAMRISGPLARAALKNGDKPGGKLPNVEVPEYELNFQYSRGRRQDKPVDVQLPPDYLPQALGQLLPRLLPVDPGQYMFSFYVSGERKLMRRYVDVQEAREVELDGKVVRAVPISDRIGVDGIPTIQYVTRQGEWLGSVNEEAKLMVLPTDEDALKEIWKNDKLGFGIAPPPPITIDEEPKQKRRHVPERDGPVNLQGLPSHSR